VSLLWDATLVGDPEEESAPTPAPGSASVDEQEPM